MDFLGSISINDLPIHWKKNSVKRKSALGSITQRSRSSGQLKCQKSIRMPNLQSPPFAISLPCLFLITSQASLEIKREKCKAQNCEASFHVMAGTSPAAALWGHWQLVWKLTQAVWSLEVTQEGPRFSSIPGWCIQNSLHTLESVFRFNILSLNNFRKRLYSSPEMKGKKRG